MKRQCPNCKENKVYYKFFTSHKYMKCQTCASLYTYSKTMNLTIFITGFSGSILMYIFTSNFWPGILPIVFMFISGFISGFIATILITQYLPLKQIANEDIAITIPLKIDFEKTDDVNTNIERYKEAIKEAKEEAKEEKLKEKTNKLFK